MTPTKDPHQIVHEISAIRKNIKRKHAELTRGIYESQQDLEKRLRPITDPLLKLVENQEKEKPKGLYPATGPLLAKKDDTIHEEKTDMIPDQPLELVDTPKKKFEYDPVMQQETEEYVSEPEYTVEEQIKTPEGKMKATILIKKTFKGPITKQYMQNAITNLRLNTDKAYGIHLEGNQMKIGDFPVTFDDNDDIIINDNVYPGTRGLFELLFKKTPSDTVYTEEDLNTYKDILNQTNVHRAKNSPSGKIKSNSGLKYKNIVSKLFPMDSEKKHGKGLETMMVLDESKKVEYVYFDDPNELCERLKLLLSSKEAGHTGHDNEIISIIEELRERGLIKGDVKL